MSDQELDEIAAKLEALKEAARERSKHLQPNQCPGCGAYRLDGKPPMVHEHGCPWENDWLDHFMDYFNPR